MAITAEHGAIARYVGEGIGAAIAAAILFFGGWAFLVWLGALPMPKSVGNWWLAPVAVGVWVALNLLLVELRRQGELTVARYLGEGIHTTIAAAVFFFGGWALLVWFGALPKPNAVGNWWLVPVAVGVYQALKVLLIDLRSGGEFPKFFAFWGPYRTRAFLDAVVGLVLAFSFIKFTSADSAPAHTKLILLVLASAYFAFFGLSEVANKRREYPLLAAFDLIILGAFFGCIGGFVCYGAYLVLTNDIVSETAMEHWFGSFAVLGAIANLWQRHGSSWPGNVLAGIGSVSLEMGTTINALVAFVKGSLWLGLAFFLIRAVGFPTNIVGWIVFSTGFVAGGKGLVEMGGALHRDESVGTGGPVRRRAKRQRGRDKGSREWNGAQTAVGETWL